jgi:hypothetical protein
MKNPPVGAGLIHGHFTMPISLDSGVQRLMRRQSPVFQPDSSGNTVSWGSRSKLSAVLSSNKMVMASPSASTLSTIFPLTGKLGSLLERRLRERVVLEAAIGRLSSEGDFVVRAAFVVTHGAARFCFKASCERGQGKSELPKNSEFCPTNRRRRLVIGQSHGMW